MHKSCHYFDSTYQRCLLLWIQVHRIAVFYQTIDCQVHSFLNSEKWQNGHGYQLHVSVDMQLGTMRVFG